MNHEQVQKNYPTGGWGYFWVGDADLGYGRRQPGGFFYNILPFMELKNIHEMSRKTHVPNDATKQMLSTVMGVFNCPSRRAPILSPAHAVLPGTLNITNCTPFKDGIDALYHGDYKCNAGSRTDWWGGGPGTWTVAETTNFGTTDCTGVSYQRSQVKIRDIVDGTAHTYLGGEKYMNPDNYYSGLDYSDDQPFLGADDYDLCGWGDVQPIRDRRGVSYTSTANPFGSIHPYTFNMVMCDGSVTSVSYDIALSATGTVDLSLFRSNCCINDRYYKKIGKF